MSARTFYSARRVAAAATFVLSLTGAADAQRFYPDDPLWKEPPPEDTVDPQRTIASSLLELFTNEFSRPGERQPSEGVIPAQNVNTLGEVPDSPWFTNRHGRSRLSVDALRAGPGNDDPPRFDQPLRVVTVKPYGDMVGILAADADDSLYLLRFDIKNHPELQTGAALVSSRLFYAAGYNTLESYLVYLDRDDLVVGDGAEQITSFGELRDLLPSDVDEFLETVHRDRQRGYRAVAIRAPRTTILGNYSFSGTRSDDPNDIVPHEHRRDLRGQWVMNAWLANHTFNAANTLEALDFHGNAQYVRRYVMGHFKTLGAGQNGPKEARDGYEYRFELGTALKNVAGMGILTPAWARASYTKIRGVGRFEGETFDADAWTADARLATWDNRLPDDLYWGAKLVMSFSDDDIRAIVETGGYTDERATDWITNALIQRRDKIGRAFLTKVLPLDEFRISDGRVEFDDLMVTYGFREPVEYEFTWFEFDNDTERSTLLAGESTGDRALPQAVRSADEGDYFAVGISTPDVPGQSVIAYLRKEGSGFNVVGLERNWRGKLVVAPSSTVTDAVAVRRYGALDDARKALVEGPARAYNETTGRSWTPEEWYDQLSLSERTTFEAVTNALMKTELRDANGEDLGTAFDLISGLERIAGQYAGRGGDQQFRLYVKLKPETEETLERSTQFHFGHENTVYHVGYPRSYRQEGDEPNMQFSVSEDGLRGDIDVDYRASKSPQALFNGHLTSANSDVRAGDNYNRHTGRWDGLVNWWQDVLGGIGLSKASGTDLLSRKIGELPTPLPPDRPLGAAPQEVYEAAQEFLTDWLVREKIDEAMLFFSRRAIACINLDDESNREVLDVDSAVVAMREIMSLALDEIEDRDNLTEAIDAVSPQNDEQASRFMSHPYESDFSVIQVRNRVAAQYTCSTRRGGNPPEMPGGPDALGTYYAVIFRFKAQDDLGGALGLLWDRLEGEWRIVSYDVLEL